MNETTAIRIARTHLAQLRSAASNADAAVEDLRKVQALVQSRLEGAMSVANRAHATVARAEAAETADVVAWVEGGMLDG